MAPDCAQKVFVVVVCFVFILFFMNGFGLKNADQIIIILLPFIKTERKQTASQEASCTTNCKPLISPEASLSSELSVEKGKQDSYSSWHQAHLAAASS